MLCYDITYVFLFLTLKGLGPCQTFKISIHLGKQSRWKTMKTLFPGGNLPFRPFLFLSD